MRKIVLILFSLIVLVGCGQKMSDDSGNFDGYNPSEPGYVNDGPTDGDDSEEAPPFGEDEVEESTDTKKIITNIHYQLESKEFDEDLKRINSSARFLGGRIKSLVVSGEKASEQYPSFRIVEAIYQIPADKLDEFNENFEGIAMVSQNMSSDDVSKSYRDNNLRIESLETQHERLLELITTAETVDALIILESRLSELELEINRLKGTNLEIEDLSDNVTISIRMREVDPSDRLTTDTSFSSRIAEAFNQMIHNTIKGLETIVLSIILYLPFFLIVGALALVGTLIFKKTQKKQENNQTSIKNETNQKEDR